MAHSSMYELQILLRQEVYELENEVRHLRYQADQLEHKRAGKLKRLADLDEQIQRVNEYEAKQREKETAQ